MPRSHNAVNVHDLRYAIRTLRRSSFVAAITILTLALGIGGVTALFAIVNAVLLDPIVPDQDRVVRIWHHDVERGLPRAPISYPEFRAWREQARSFEGLAAIQYADASSFPIIVDDQPSAVEVTPVSANFFAVLYGGAPRHGRWLEAADERAGAELAAVVSERFFRRAAGGDPAVVGSRLTFGGARTALVVGVAPAEFEYPLGADIWVPIGRFFDGREGRFDAAGHWLKHFELLGRLAPGVSWEQARAELAVIRHEFITPFPDDYRPMEIVIEPLLHTVVGNGGEVLLVLFAAAGLVFLIAGVNVGALLLMRASERRTELAVRVALGASHARLARQTLAEGVVLGVSGALGGLLIARVLLGIAQWLAPGSVPRIERATLDFGVLLFCGIAALLWLLAIGTVPVWSQRRIEAATGFGSCELVFRGVRGTRGLRLFTISEIAAAVVVAIGAGLLVQSFIHLQGIDRGFNSTNLAVFRLLLPESRYPDARTRLAFYERLLPHVIAVPGVMAASPVHLSPGTGIVGLSAPMLFEGQTPDEAATNPWGSWEPVTPSYFRTLGVPIVQGRSFSDADGRDTQPVAIVSEAVARRYWPNQNPLGKRLQFVRASQFPWATVVGVAADLRYRELTKNWLTVYFPAAQFFFFQPGSLVVRTASDPRALVPAIRQTIRSQEPHAALDSIETMDTLVARELSRPRTALTVAALFALMAVVLAAVGVYGVLSYEVRARGREIAVRSALGASPAQIFRAVLWRSVTLGGIGAVVGLVVALAVTRSLGSLLFQVEPADPPTFLAGAAALLGIVLIASYLPARRAADADPAAVLRTE